MSAVSQEEKKKKRRRKAVVPLLLLKISLVKFSLSQRLAAQTRGLQGVRGRRGRARKMGKRRREREDGKEKTGEGEGRQRGSVSTTSFLNGPATVASFLRDSASIAILLKGPVPAANLRPLHLYKFHGLVIHLAAHRRAPALSLPCLLANHLGSTFANHSQRGPTAVAGLPKGSVSVAGLPRGSAFTAGLQPASPEPIQQPGHPPGSPSEGPCFDSAPTLLFPELSPLTSASALSCLMLSALGSTPHLNSLRTCAFIETKENEGDPKCEISAETPPVSVHMRDDGAIDHDGSLAHIRRRWCCEDIRSRAGISPADSANGVHWSSQVKTLLQGARLGFFQFVANCFVPGRPENLLFKGALDRFKVKQTIAIMKALPDIFPSPVAPPKKLGHASEAMLHILASAEDPNTFLQTRPLSSPVVIVCETNCILAIKTMPVLIFPKEDISDSVMYIMAYYNTFHLTYPKCLATLLSVLQTEVLMDAIHDRDMTSSYKKSYG
ncbi:hypothetical protein L3Q82_000760 [Scortum barcoo]|uniref:Uncharacterized protein n=1 Tax=Scortum barcoo TaxID=214431 RepID=A0ACB8WCJ5_9TELE|nr:hypothetical protein L3Q82_000760 [Scortum barcoo]